jgi:hypothetical protein
MRIRSWLRVQLSFLLLAVALPAAAQQSITLASGKTITASVTSTQTILHLPGTHSRRPRVVLEHDATIAKGVPPSTLKLIAEVPGSAILLTDTYPSLPGGLSYCQAGEEQFLRVITTSGRRPIETYHIKLASCRDNIELAQPGLTWSPTTKTLDIHWLTRSSQPATVTLTIDSNGKPSVANPLP